MLQQYLPFTVLKLKKDKLMAVAGPEKVATVLTVYGIETKEYTECDRVFFSCNSTYRLRYWNYI